MAPNGSKWVKMGYMGPNGATWVQMGLNESKWGSNTYWSSV